MATRSVAWARAAILILIGATALMLLFRSSPKPPPSAPVERPAPNFDRVYLKDVAYSAYVRGEKTFTLRAEEILHRKRKLGPLTIHPIKEVEMNGVRIEIFHDRAPGGDADASGDLDLPIQSILKESLSSKDLGFVSRVLMNRFQLDIRPSGTEPIHLEAGKARVGLDSAALRLEDGVGLSTPLGERLAAQSAEWRFDSRRLHVAGAFVWTEGGTTHRGEATSFRIGLDGRLTGEADSPADRP